MSEPETFTIVVNTGATLTMEADNFYGFFELQSSASHKVFSMQWSNWIILAHAILDADIKSRADGSDA